LKSGARGLRFEVRSSHIAPPQIGHSGMPAESTRGPPAVGAERAELGASAWGVVPAARAVAPAGARCAGGGATTGPPAAVAGAGRPDHPVTTAVLALEVRRLGIALPLAIVPHRASTSRAVGNGGRIGRYGIGHATRRVKESAPK
jgi:hypothetical protein